MLVYVQSGWDPAAAQNGNTIIIPLLVKPAVAVGLLVKIGNFSGALNSFGFATALQSKRFWNMKDPSTKYDDGPKNYLATSFKSFIGQHE